MASDRSPVELLSAAADRVRDLSAAATEGPWEVDRQYSHANVVYAKHDLIDSVGVAGRRMDLTPVFTGQIASRDRSRFEADARWIAALSPAVAPHIERILRESGEAWAKAGKALADDRAVINPSVGELYGWWGTRNLSLEDRVSEHDQQALALAKAILGVDAP